MQTFLVVIQKNIFRLVFLLLKKERNWGNRSRWTESKMTRGSPMWSIISIQLREGFYRITSLEVRHKISTSSYSMLQILHLRPASFKHLNGFLPIRLTQIPRDLFKLKAIGQYSRLYSIICVPAYQQWSKTADIFMLPVFLTPYLGNNSSAVFLPWYSISPLDFLCFLQFLNWTTHCEHFVLVLHPCTNRNRYLQLIMTSMPNLTTGFRVCVYFNRHAAAVSVHFVRASQHLNCVGTVWQ